MASRASGPQGTSKKRNRVPLSCNSCRTRKLKCDRQNPCQNCISRGFQSTCSFATIATNGSRPRPTGHTLVSDEMRSRLQRLESLIGSMAQTNMPMATKHIPESSPDGRPNVREPEDSKNGQDLSTRSAILVGQQFVAAGNWEAVLQDLAVIREHFEDGTEGPQDDFISESKNPALLSGISCDLSRAELLLGLPGRALADRLLHRFFDTYDPAVPSRLVHEPTFMKQYAEFWANTEQATVTMIGLLYSIFCLALQTYDRQDDEPLDLRGITNDLSETYRKRAVQCVIKSDITKPSHQGLELLVLCGISEYARNNDATTAEWFCVGIVVRKAFHMGYHRDPDAFANLSPFAKEMRRRLWAHIWQIDTLFSFSLGLPSAVSKTNSNVKSPLNLFEEDLFEEMMVLPPAYPATVMTPISYIIAKLDILRALAGVVDHMGSVEEHTYSEIFDLNNQLTNAVRAIPEFLLIKSWEDSVMDPKSLRLQRLQLRMFYDKASCTLNRRFLNMPFLASRSESQVHPRDLCIESALSLLSIQAGFHRERTKWYIFALQRHDYLLAAVILFLVICKKQGGRACLQNMTDSSFHPMDDEDLTILCAIQKSREIWGEYVSISSHARLACRMFDKMREKYHLPTSDLQTSIPMASFVTQPHNTIPMRNTKTQDLDVQVPSNQPLVGNTPIQFDWSAWESSFDVAGMAGMEMGFDDLDAFWPSPA